MTDATSALIENTLEIAADKDSDIVPLVYARFFAAAPAAVAHFAISPGERAPNWMGDMANELIECLTAEDEGELRLLVNAVAVTHCGKGIDSQLYRSLCDSLVGALREVAGAAWTSEHQSAWRARVDRLMRMMDQELETLL